MKFKNEQEFLNAFDRKDEYTEDIGDSHIFIFFIGDEFHINIDFITSSVIHGLSNAFDAYKLIEKNLG